MTSSAWTVSFSGRSSRLLIRDARSERLFSATRNRWRESASATSAWSTSFLVTTPALEPHLRVVLVRLVLLHLLGGHLQQFVRLEQIVVGEDEFQGRPVPGALGLDLPGLEM